MKTKRMKWITLATIASLGLLTATYAWAASWSDFFPIWTLYMDNGTNGMVMQPLAGTFPNNSKNDPAHCVEPDSVPITRVFIMPAVGATDRDLINKAALGAFLAGRKVQVLVSSSASNCVSGMPGIAGIAMDTSH